MNNLRKIREIYGITQEEIAKAINVNRATISAWETQEERKASSSSLEKLSLFYGIEWEYFYEQEINDTIKDMLSKNSKRQKEIEEKAEGHHVKAEDFNKLFSSVTFDQALQRYMHSTKILLATAEEGSINKLEVALKINKKLGVRLESILQIRKNEEQEDESLAELIDSLNSEE